MVIRIKTLFDIRAIHHIMLGGLEEGKKIMHFNRRKRLKSNKHYLLRKKKL
jgi:hypothetical protein